MQAAVTAMREAANPKLSCEDRQEKRLKAYGSLDQLESPLNVIFGKMSKQGVFKDGQLAKILKAGKLETEAGQVTAFGQQLNALIEQAKQGLKTNPVPKESFFNRMLGLTKSKSLPAESAAAARPLSDEDDSDKEEPDMVDKGLEMIDQIIALQADLPTLFAAVQSDPGNPEKLEKLATLLLGKESIIMHLLVSFGGEKGKAIQENLALVYSYIDFILREKQVLEKACSAPVAAASKKRT